jgi:hypothetical protein
MSIGKNRFPYLKVAFECLQYKRELHKEISIQRLSKLQPVSSAPFFFLFGPAALSRLAPVVVHFRGKTLTS